MDVLYLILTIFFLFYFHSNIILSLSTSFFPIFLGVLVNIILNSIKQAVNSSAPRKMEVYSAVSIFIIHKSCFDFTSKVSYMKE